MILAIDIGNTNIVLGCVEGKKTYFIERLSTDKAKTELEYAVSLKNVLELYEIPVEQIEGGIISSVVPQVTELCRSAAEKVIKKPVKVVGPGVKTGLNIKLDDPATAGSDLVVVAVAALNEYTCPQIVIDMGTATTMSVLDQKGSFIGGVILPGLRTSLDALVSNAAQLSQTSLTAPKKVIGKNTLDCMKGGMIYGNAASIDGMIERMEEELGCKCTIVATGGLAKAVIPHCRHDIIIDEAHRVAGSSGEVARYKLGYLLSQASPYLLLLTATPHNGKTEPFLRLVRLLDGDAFPNAKSVVKEQVAPFLIRTEKREAIDNNGNLLFKNRVTHLVELTWDERHTYQRQLYEMVTSYVSKTYNKALRNRKKNMCMIFLLIIMQRMVTSSTAAIRQSLERRLEILKTQNTKLGSLTEEDLAELDIEDSVEDALQAMSLDMEEEISELENIIAGWI